MLKFMVFKAEGEFVYATLINSRFAKDAEKIAGASDYDGEWFLYGSNSDQVAGIIRGDTERVPSSYTLDVI